jgi:hypothetical protein
LQEGKTVADSLISLSNQINDGSIQFVKDGDTLSQIAQDNGLSLNELLALNPQYKANPDDVSTIPSPSRSRVSGERITEAAWSSVLSESIRALMAIKQPMALKP